MSIGNFNETSDSSNEFKETNESKDNVEKPRNQILDLPGSYDDDFKKRLDSIETRTLSEENSLKKNTDDVKEKNGEEKLSLLDKMRNLFSRKENKEEKDNKDADRTNETQESGSTILSDAHKSFVENLRKDAPSMEAQAEAAKKRQDRNYESNVNGNESNGEANDSEHGEDGERTRWSDAQWAREHRRP
jgi:hypothetical protein